MEEREEIDIFKVLSHPLRREIILYIAKKRGASYKDLIKIVPKPGALYHHLRLLGDLIYQDENKVYYLTEKGRRVYDFLVSEFLIPEEKSVHILLTPRPLLELIEGKIAILLLILCMLSNFIWILRSDVVPIFILIAPVNHPYFLGPIIAACNWIGSNYILTYLVRVLFRRHISLEETIKKSVPVFLIVNLYPIFIIEENVLIIATLYVLVQFFGLMFSISAVSVVARLPLRSSLVTVIILHYMALIVTVLIIITGISIVF